MVNELKSTMLTIIALIRCYGPYIQDSIGTKRELVLDQDQCAENRTNRTSKAIGRGVAESHNRSQAAY